MVQIRGFLAHSVIIFTTESPLESRSSSTPPGAAAYALLPAQSCVLTRIAFAEPIAKSTSRAIEDLHPVRFLADATSQPISIAHG